MFEIITTSHIALIGSVFAVGIVLIHVFLMRSQNKEMITWFDLLNSKIERYGLSLAIAQNPPTKRKQLQEELNLKKAEIEKLEKEIENEDNKE